MSKKTRKLKRMSEDWVKISFQHHHMMRMGKEHLPINLPEIQQPTPVQVGDIRMLRVPDNRTYKVCMVLVHTELVESGKRFFRVSPIHYSEVFSYTLDDSDVYIPGIGGWAEGFNSFGVFEEDLDEYSISSVSSDIYQRVARVDCVNLIGNPNPHKFHDVSESICRFRQFELMCAFPSDEHGLRAMRYFPPEYL